MIFTLPPLVAEPIFHIATFPVTNTYITSVFVTVIFVIFGLLIRNQTELIPSKIQNFVESIIDTMLFYFDQVTHDRKKSIRFFPIVGSLFLFILLSNWLGVLPGIGSIGRHLSVNGKIELVPIFRSANSDLNLTLAMALFSVIISHIFGIVMIGFFKYANKFVKLGDLIKSFKRGSMGVFVAIVEMAVGLIEIISEIAKVISLSLRLFGNIFAGEVLLTVLAGLIAYLVPLPFIFLELLVGIIQALVFAMLTLTYLTVATMPIEA